MAILKKIHLVASGDGKPRYRVVWKHRKFTYFALPSELRELAKTILDLIREEPSAIKHLGNTNGTGEVRPTATRSAQESPQIHSKPNPR